MTRHPALIASGRQSAGDGPAGGEKRHIDVGEDAGLCLLHGQLLVAPGQRLARGTAGGEEAQPGNGKIPFQQKAQQLLTGGACGPDDGYRIRWRLAHEFNLGVIQ